MTFPRTLFKALLGIYAATTLLTPLAARAATTTYLADTTVTVGTYPLTIKAGSQARSLTTTGTTLTVTVAAGEALDLRTANPPYALENDAGEPSCSITTFSENQMIITGPRTVTITPISTTCSTAGAGSKQTPFLTIAQPNGGETLTEGQTYQIFWQSAGTGVASVRLQYTLDAGAAWTTIVDGDLNDGFHAWTVPQVYTSDTARLRIDGYSQGKVVALDISDANFRMQGTLAPPAPPQGPTPGPTLTVTPYDYDPEEETRSAETIGVDKNLPAAPQSQLICHPDSRIKAREFDTVYYCGRDGKRYVFPNRKTHDSWYGTFAGVIELDLATMQQIPLGGNVTYRPGVRLLKIQSAPEVFAVAADGTLRYVSATAVVRLYGPDWATKVDDLPDPFFTDYVIGDAIME